MKLVTDLFFLSSLTCYLLFACTSCCKGTKYGKRDRDTSTFKLSFYFIDLQLFREEVSSSRARKIAVDSVESCQEVRGRVS